MPDQLLVELIISDDKATAVIGKNRRALESFASDTERLKPKFGKNFESEFDAVERRANSFRDKLTNSFRTIGAAVSFAAVFKFLDGAKDKAFEAEKANFRLASAATEAGLAYGVLGQKSRQFANDAGLAETAAASVEARIAQLATFSGKPENIDKLNTAFLDLSAAKGISSNELDNLIGTILSGQDEGLNRLGIGDPSTLYAKYKVEIGAVSRELTQMEKVQAAVNAVLEKSATFAGANADKMNSLSGQAERASAQLDNLYTNFGEGLANSLEFRAALTTVNQLLESLSTNTARVREELSGGISPKQLAEREANSTGSQIIDTGKNALTSIVAPVLYPLDLINEGFDAANKRFIESVSGAKERRIQELTSLFDGEKKLIEKQAADARKQADIAGLKQIKESIPAIVKARTGSLEKELDALSRAGAKLQTLDDVRAKLAQAENFKFKLAVNQDFFDADDYQKQIDRIDAIISQNQERIAGEIEKGKNKVKELEKTYNSVLDSIFQRSNSDNPFANLFSEADKQLKSLRENTRGLSQDLISQFEQIEAKTNSLKLFESRIDNNLGAFDLRDQAKNFRNAGQSENDKRRFEEIAKRGAAEYGLDFDKLTDSQKRDQYERRLFRANPATNPNLIGALATDRLRNPNENQSLNERLNAQLKIINDGAFSPEQKAIADKKLISLTNGLDPNSLTSDLREKAALAREREAVRKESLEKDAIEQRKLQIEYQAQIAENGKRLIEIAEKEGLKGVEIIVKDQTKDGIESNPTKANSNDTAAQYGAYQNALR